MRGPRTRSSSKCPQQELERLEYVVNDLPEQCRRAFQLQKFQGLSQKEIALEMNIAEKTVEKHLAVALVRVLGALKEGHTITATLRPQPGISGHDSERSKD